MAATVEGDALGFEQLLLDAGPEPVPMAAAAGRVDHAVPGHRLDVGPAERAERHADGARAARLPEDRRDLPVGDDASTRDAADDAVDQQVEARRTGPRRLGCGRLAQRACLHWPRVSFTTARAIPSRLRRIHAWHGGCLSDGDGMRYHVLATDYDGTLARDGRVDDATIDALVRVRRSGRKLVLVTGRELEDLTKVFHRLDLFDLVVAENGALVHRPATHESRVLAEPPPAPFVDALRARGVAPLSIGHVIVATWQPHEETVLDVIRTLGLELQVIFNKGAVMVLPSGVNKAFGLAAALDDLSLSVHNALGIGDAENDHAFLTACECSVAVANALPALKERCDFVTAGDHGRGVQELVAELVDTDLAGRAATLTRRDLVVGEDADQRPVRLSPYGPPVLVAGPSGGGKSTFATALLEELARQGYQFSIVDPEGDYHEIETATVLGDAGRAPGIDEALELLRRPAQSCVLNLLGIALPDRPAFFATLLPRLQEMRAHFGRPHWILVDEAHHLLPAQWRASPLTLPRELVGLLLVTVHPESIAPALLAEVGVVVAVGGRPDDTLGRFATAAGVEPPTDVPVAEGRAVMWCRAKGRPPSAFTVAASRAERRRHVRKYAAGDLGPDKSFYFRGPEGRLNLRAQNLQTFVQIAEGVDDDTWLHHLGLGHYSRWMREAIKDDTLADETARVERDGPRDAAASRARIRGAIEQRYTAPA